MTWICNICDKERPDDKISVYTYVLKDLLAERNLRYCNDKPECYQGAVEKGKTGKI